MQISKFFNRTGLMSLCLMTAAFFVFLPGSASAARLYFEHQPENVGVGDTIAASLMLDPQGVSVNAIQATITFSSNLSLLSVSDADSVIGQWIERDTTTTANALRALSLAGIMPGGYSGTLGAYWNGARAGKVIMLVFRTTNAGNATIGIADPSVLANDGKGTPVAVDVAGDLFVVASLPSANSRQSQPKYASVDVVPPDAFTPLVANSPALFGGRYFVSFSTRDNASGIAGYQVAQSPVPVPPADYRTALAWHDAASPYVLPDQTLQSYIYVKAIDGAGNARVAVVPPSPVASWHEAWLLVLAGAAGIVFVCVAGWYILYAYHKKRHVLR